jgi:hypothetical protein
VCFVARVCNRFSGGNWCGIFFPLSVPIITSTTLYVTTTAPYAAKNTQSNIFAESVLALFANMNAITFSTILNIKLVYVTKKYFETCVLCDTLGISSAITKLNATCFELKKLKFAIKSCSTYCSQEECDADGES